MSKREPNLELLLNGGDLLAMSPLRYGSLRASMLEALRSRLPQHAQLDKSEPGVALVEALAACLDIVGFYHDRILTESKLGSAVLLKSMAQLGEVIGYRPRPPLAAVAYQFFLATLDGLVPAGCKVAGRAGEPPMNVVFETRSTITIGPAFNQMALSPLINRYAGAVRATLKLLTTACRADLQPSAVSGQFIDSSGLGNLFDQISVEQASQKSLPLDDFPAGTLALLNGPHGLEMCKVSSSRRRGIAFDTPLVRSYDENATVISRATSIRHLRFWRPLGTFEDSTLPSSDQGPDQVVFEITDRPILHYPNPASPEQLTSSLEVFVFDNSDEIGDPTTWESKLAWKRVDDFSSSEASDHHYRVIVDDRLNSYLVLRRRLGYRVLLNDTALCRVYVRFVPAIGRILAPEPQGELIFNWPAKGQTSESDLASDAKIATVADVTMTLDPAYFESAMVRPKVNAGVVRNTTTFAVISDDIGLKAGDQIALHGGASGQTFFRTLTEKTHGRYLSWASRTAGGFQTNADISTVDESTDPSGIDDVFDAAKTTLSPLSEVARGQTYPLWEAYYKQAQAPDTVGKTWKDYYAQVNAPDMKGQLQNDLWLPTKRLPPDRGNLYLSVPKGSTFLLLDDSSHVKSGDFLLIGRRLRWDYRDTKPERLLDPSGWEGGPPYFDTRLPWLTAEVLQVVEVQGNVVRFRDAVSQDFYRDYDNYNEKWVSDVVAVPSVASVYYGDCFVEPVALEKAKTCVFNTLTIDPYYTRVALSSEILGSQARERLGWTYLHNTAQWSEMFARLFVAVSSQTVGVPDASWSRIVAIPTRNLSPAHVKQLAFSTGQTLSTLSVVATNSGEFEVELGAGSARLALEHFEEIVALVGDVAPNDLCWTPVTQGSTPGISEFSVANQDGWHFFPIGHGPIAALDRNLLRSGGTLLVDMAPGLAFSWQQNGDPQQQPGLLLSGTMPPHGDEINVVAIPSAATFALNDTSGGSGLTKVADWSVDWQIGIAFPRLAWPSRVLEGYFALGDRDAPAVHFQYDTATASFIAVNVALSSGTSLSPFAAGTELWALPTEDSFSLSPNDIQARWRFGITLAQAELLVPSWEGMLAVWRAGETPIVAPATLVDASGQPEGKPWLVIDLAKETRDLTKNLSGVLALATLPVTFRRRVWNIATAGDPLLNDASRLVALELTQELSPGNLTTSVELAELWPTRDKQLKPILLVPEATESVPSQVSRIVRYHWDSISDPVQEVDADGNAVIHGILPLSWPKDGNGTPFLPAQCALNMLETGTCTRIKSASISITPNDHGFACHIVLDGDDGLEWAKIYLGLCDLPIDGGVTEHGALGTNSVPWAPGEDAGMWLCLRHGDFAHSYTAVIAITTLQKSESEFLLIPATDHVEFGSDAIVEAYWSVVAWTGPADTLPELAGETRVFFPSNPLSISARQFGELGSLVLGSERPWQRRSIVPGGIDTNASGWSVLLEDDISAIVPEGSPAASTSVRFVYDVSSTQPGASCSALRLRGKFAKDELANLGLLLPTSGAKSVLFHGDRYDNAITVALGSIGADGVVELLLDTAMLGRIFTADSRPSFPAISFVQEWDKLDRASISNHMLLTLGPAPFGDVVLQAGDELMLEPSTRTKVLRVAGTGVYELSATHPITQVRLFSIAPNLTPAKFSATVRFNPPSEQPPWLLTTTQSVGLTGSIRDSLLRYHDHFSVNGTHTFTFRERAVLESIFAIPEPTLYLYLNQRSQLRENLYLASIDALEKDNFLKTDEGVAVLLAKRDSPVFPVGAGSSLQVLLCDNQWRPSATEVGLPAVEWTTSACTKEHVGVSVVSQSIVFNSGNFIPVLGASSSSDIEVVGSSLRVFVESSDRGVEPVQIVPANSLSVDVANIENNTYIFTPGTFTRKYSFSKLPGGTFALNFLLIGYDDAKVLVFVEYAAPRIERESIAEADGAATTVLTPDEVSALTLEQVAALTLAQLAVFGPAQLVALSPIQMAALTPIQLVALTSTQLDAITPAQLAAIHPATIDEASRIYQFETNVKVLNPRSELVVLDSGGLKADDYVFLHSAAANSNGRASTTTIEPTRVRAVAGPIVSVASELDFDIAAFYQYFLCGYSRPPKPVGLDKEYYALLKTAVFEPPPPTDPISVDAAPPLSQPEAAAFSMQRLALIDRLVIDPNTAANQTLLAALIPGDQLLVWNERWRESWYAKRLGVANVGNEQWFDFAQYQHVAAVKSIDKDTGLLLLSEPLPERFSVGLKVTEFMRYVAAADSQPAHFESYEPRRFTVELEPVDPAIRVLPHYRAPFQGICSLKVLGSGDKNRKFARYTGTMASDSGLGTITLLSEKSTTFSDKMYASNVEVLSREPRSGEWNRWVQLVDIARAERKDRAFTLGVDLAAIGAAADAGDASAAGDAASTTVPFAVGFGDGKQGQLLPTGNDNVYARVTSIGPQQAHVESRRPLRILDARLGPAPFTVPAEAAAVPVNLWLRIEFGGHEGWNPVQRSVLERPLAAASPRGDWRSSLLVEVNERLEISTVGSNKVVGLDGVFKTWIEIDRAEAEAGYDGVFVQGVRPGVVDVFFFAGHTINMSSARAWEVPDHGTWILDSQFYAAMAKADPSRATGAKCIGLRETDGIRPGSLLAFSRDDVNTSEIVAVDTVDRDTWSATLSTALAQTYPLENSFLRGNLVEVVQGSTDTFILGSGDGSTQSLRLSLHNRSPILYALDFGKSAPTPRVTVTVGGVVWSRVESFAGCLPRDRVWRLDVETDTSAWVVFGDGVEGAVPPFGTNNITATIATGAGELGNLPAKSVNKLLDGNLAVKETWNLTDAAGGKVGETAGQVRDTLLSRKGGIANIVSAEDAARVALDVGEVLHARVDPTAPKDMLRLVVALDGRRAISEQVRKTIAERIQARLPATCDMVLNVVGAEQVAVHLAATIEISEGYLPAAVLDAAERAFAANGSGFFAPKRWPLGEPMRLGDVYEALFAVAGLASAQVTWMSTEKIDPSMSLVNEVLNPGASGVIRCDNQPTTDPHQNYGSIKFTLSGAAQ